MRASDGGGAAAAAAARAATWRRPPRHRGTRAAPRRTLRGRGGPGASIGFGAAAPCLAFWQSGLASVLVMAARGQVALWLLCALGRSGTPSAMLPGCLDGQLGKMELGGVRLRLRAAAPAALFRAAWLRARCGGWKLCKCVRQLRLVRRVRRGVTAAVQVRQGALGTEPLAACVQRLCALQTASRRIGQPRASLAALYSARPALGRSWPRLSVASCGWADKFCVLYWVLQVVALLAVGVAVSLQAFDLWSYCMSVAALTLGLQRCAWRTEADRHAVRSSKVVGSTIVN